MKHNFIKKVGALALAAVMTMGMSASVFASSADLGVDKSLVDDSTKISKAGVNQNGTGVDSDNDGTNESATYAAVGNKISIDKEIVIFNTNTSDTVVYLPNITYTYTIAAATVASDKHITDEFNLSGTIYSGVEDALSTKTATIAYSNGTSGSAGVTGGQTAAYVTTTSDGVAVAGKFDIEFNSSKFSHAGIYRYVITESANDRAAAAVSNTEYVNTRYLDVYVKNGENGLEIYGYVLYEGSLDADAEFDADSVAAKSKTNGFVSDKFDNEGNTYSKTETDVDIYDTTNLKIEKLVSGALADKTNEFPFQVDITTTTSSQPIISYVYNAETATPDGSNAVITIKTVAADGKTTIGSATATTADNFELKHQDYIYIYGVPYYAVTNGNNGQTTHTEAGASAVVTEYNNTTDTYLVTAEFNTTKDSTLDGSYSMAKSTTAATASTETLTNNAIDTTIVTNSLDAVSPTNVVLRFAPFIIMAAFALVLFFVLRRQRDDKHSDMI